MNTNGSLTTGGSRAAPQDTLGSNGDTEAVNPGALNQYVSFHVGDEEYAVDIMVVREIKAWVETTMVPNTPQHMRGVLNLRGTIVPIFDLKCRFGLGQTETTETSVVIIVHVQDRVIGLLVDAVSDILDIYDTQIRTVPRMDRTVDDAYLTGLVSVQERLVALLDVKQLFSASVVEDGASIADQSNSNSVL